MEEPEAIRRSRNGDQAAFRSLVERYGDLVYRTAYLMLHDRGLAEDLTQETFLAAWKGLKGFDASLPFKPWLLRIVVNRCLNQQRRRAPQTVPLIAEAGMAAGQGPSPEVAAVQRDTQRLIRRAIASLEEDQRLAVMLRYFAGLSVPEIASVVSCPQGTVKSRLHRALAHLRVRLEGSDQGALRKSHQWGEQP